MPRNVARVLADRLDVDVAWSALGLTGADVRAIHGELLPRLSDEVRRIMAPFLSPAIHVPAQLGARPPRRPIM